MDGPNPISSDAAQTPKQRERKCQVIAALWTALWRPGDCPRRWRSQKGILLSSEEAHSAGRRDREQRLGRLESRAAIAADAPESVRQGSTTHPARYRHNPTSRTTHRERRAWPIPGWFLR